MAVTQARRGSDTADAAISTISTTARPGAGPQYAARGMVASASPAAAATGLRVLMDGGNAFDAR
jgi:gamma-glutamyltranspeptidase